MGKLSNSYENCVLLNMTYGPKGRGPFVVRQDGYLPGSQTFQENRYLLRRDGTWVLNLAVFALPEQEKEQFLYESSGEVMTLLQGLAGDPTIEEGLPADKSRADLELAAESTVTGLWGRIRSAQASRMAP